METKFTKGPWGRNIKPATKYNTVYAGRNTHVCHLATAGLQPDEVEANCTLITAAPDMFGAAAWMLALIDGGEEMPKPGDDVAETLRAALAKARGQS